MLYIRLHLVHLHGISCAVECDMQDQCHSSIQYLPIEFLRKLCMSNMNVPFMICLLYGVCIECTYTSIDSAPAQCAPYIHTQRIKYCIVDTAFKLLYNCSQFFWFAQFSIGFSFCFIGNLEFFGSDVCLLHHVYFAKACNICMTAIGLYIDFIARLCNHSLL